MTPVYNEKNEVRTRYVIKEVKNKEWENWYKHIPTYKLVKDLKTMTGQVYGKMIIFRVPLFKEWQEDYLAENGSYKCLNCEDTGIDKITGKFCKCDLGRLAYKHFSERKIEF